MPTWAAACLAPRATSTMAAIIDRAPYGSDMQKSCRNACPAWLSWSEAEEEACKWRHGKMGECPYMQWKKDYGARRRYHHLACTRNANGKEGVCLP